MRVGSIEPLARARNTAAFKWKESSKDLGFPSQGAVSSGNNQARPNEIIWLVGRPGTPSIRLGAR
jgi:hypothetical protein